jgi:hypothetical protein
MPQSEIRKEEAQERGDLVDVLACPARRGKWPDSPKKNLSPRNSGENFDVGCDPGIPVEGKRRKQMHSKSQMIWTATFM